MLFYCILLHVPSSGKLCHHNNSRTLKSYFGKSWTFYIIHGSSCKQNLWYGIPGTASHLSSPQQVRHPRKLFRFIAFCQKITFNDTWNNVLIFLIKSSNNIILRPQLVNKARKWQWGINLKLFFFVENYFTSTRSVSTTRGCCCTFKQQKMQFLL